MNNNSAIAVFLTILLSCLYLFNQNTIESFWTVSGSKMNSAYLPQQQKDTLSIPHGSSSNNGANRDLETFNYNPSVVRSNLLEPSPSIEEEFNRIEQFQMKNDNLPSFNQTDYNTRSPQSLPAQTLSQTHIPMREDYQKAKGSSVTKVTPNGFRNGAKPLAGAGLLRGEVPIRENFSSGSTPQFGSRDEPAGNIQKRGGRENADARGGIKIAHEYQIGMQANAMNIGDIVGGSSEKYTAALPKRAMIEQHYSAALPRRVRDAIPIGTRAMAATTQPMPQQPMPQVVMPQQPTQPAQAATQPAQAATQPAQQYTNLLPVKQQYGAHNSHQGYGAHQGVTNLLPVKQQYGGHENVVKV